MAETTGNEDSETTHIPKPGTGGSPPPPPANNPFPWTTPNTPTLPPIGGQPTPEVPLVLRGQARWNAELNAALPKLQGGVEGTAYEQWVLGLKGDEFDGEYNSLVQSAKTNVNARIRKRQEEEIRKSTKNAGNGRTDVDDLKKLKQDANKRIAKEQFEDGAIFKGAPLDAERLWNNKPVDPYRGAEPEDAYRAEFNQANGKRLTGGEAAYAERSGQYVMVGWETDPRTGGKRPIYVYHEDAEGGLLAQGKTKIAQYQKMLGLPATGVDDGRLQGVWKDAITNARYKAMSGVKTTVQAEFDALMAHYAAIAKSRGGGGGGGGGNGALEDSPVDMAAVDYYMAMMGVLGDISGVQV